LWTRFHALPEAKRYAETQSEQQVILDRAAEIADHLYEDGQDVWLTTCYLNREGSPWASSKALPGITATLHFEVSRDESEFFEEPMKVEVFVCKLIWRPGQFNTLLGEIAEGRENAIWFDPLSRRVLAPYDGGFDIFLENRCGVINMEQKFGAWMSDLDSKL